MHRANTELGGWYIAIWRMCVYLSLRFPYWMLSFVLLSQTLICHHLFLLWHQTNLRMLLFCLHPPRSLKTSLRLALICFLPLLPHRLTLSYVFFCTFASSLPRPRVLGGAAGETGISLAAGGGGGNVHPASAHAGRRGGGCGTGLCVTARPANTSTRETLRVSLISNSPAYCLAALLHLM